MKRTNTATWMEDRRRWRVLVQKDGQRKAFYSTTPGRAGQREANAKADAWLDDGIDNTDRRVKDLYEEYAAEIRETTSHANSLKIDSIGANWILPAIGKKRISAVADNDLQLILNKMHRQGLAKKSIMNARATIAQFCKYCRRVKVTTLNPEFLEIPKGAKSRKKQVMSPDDLGKLFGCSTILYRGKEITDPHIHAYRFLVTSGLRPGELCGLEWQDIFDGVVHVQRSLNIHGEITAGKNANAIRNFALNDLTLGILADQLEMITGAPAHLWDDVLLGKRKASTWGNALIPLPVGRVFPCQREEYLRRRWNAFCECNGMQQTTLYEMRHTFVSVVKNLPEGQIKGLVGHSKSMDTFGIYSHELDGEMLGTAQDVSDLFKGILRRSEQNKNQA